nr:dihydrofolate reductase family protein [Rhodococcus sp. ACPA1]
MSDTSTGTGKVVVNRAMSLDGFIAGPDHAMDWILDLMSAAAFPEVMAATGAMLIGRGTYEVAKQMADEDTTYDGGPEFVLTHEPPDEPDPGVTFLTCDIAEAVATALNAAGGKTWRSSVPTWPASACSEGSSTRSWCMSCRCFSATVSASRPQASAGSTWNRSATRSRAPSPCSDSASANDPGAPSLNGTSTISARLPGGTCDGTA